MCISWATLAGLSEIFFTGTWLSETFSKYNFPSPNAIQIFILCTCVFQMLSIWEYANIQILMGYFGRTVWDIFHCLRLFAKYFIHLLNAIQIFIMCISNVGKVDSIKKYHFPFLLMTDTWFSSIGRDGMSTSSVLFGFIYALKQFWFHICRNKYMLSLLVLRIMK